MTDQQLTDANGVMNLAIAMTARLTEKRRQGFSGWEDPDQCDTTDLAWRMLDSLRGGRLVDAANFAMMLHNRQVDPMVIRATMQSYVDWVVEDRTTRLR